MADHPTASAVAEPPKADALEAFFTPPSSPDAARTPETEKDSTGHQATAKEESTADKTPAPHAEAKAEAKADEKKDDDPVALKAKLEKAEKAYRDLQSKADKTTGSLQRQLGNMEKQIKDLNAKLDGTYKEDMEPPEQKEAREKLITKVTDSIEAAKAEFGDEAIQAKILADDSPYKKLEAAQPWQTTRVLLSKDPAKEALAVLQEQAMFERWGRDPDKVLELAEKELRPKLLKELKEQANGIKPGAPVRGLSSVRGVSETTKTPPTGSAFDLDTLT